MNSSRKKIVRDEFGPLGINKFEFDGSNSVQQTENVIVGRKTRQTHQSTEQLSSSLSFCVVSQEYIHPSMADCEVHHQQQQQQQGVSKETAFQALNTIIQLHFEKTLEKKRAIDLQKKELHKLFQMFFIFLSLMFLTQSQSQRLQCRHCWIPITLLSMAHLIFYVSVAQTLRCINGFKYQRRCHKLTLGLATEKLREIKMRLSGGDYDAVSDEDFEIHYQEPPESYFGKFKRNWALHFGFLILIYGFMISSSVVLLCF